MRAVQAAIVATCVLLGVALGLGAYTFAYARGWSYLTDDPRACANCHVMLEQFDGWEAARILGVAIDTLRQGQVSLRPLAAGTQ